MDSNPNCTWPYWKFGLKKDDLNTTLHNHFNTTLSAIQDPQAFEHDVLEMSREASTTEELFRLLDQRKQKRLAELNDMLETAALEIISNPRLIGSSQWPEAVQLFRTRSLDSLVRYFASYLASENQQFGHQVASNSDMSQSCWDSHLPPSPQSLAASDSSAPSICSDDDFDCDSRHAYSDTEPDIDLHMPASSPATDDGLASDVHYDEETALGCGAAIGSNEDVPESPSGCASTTPAPSGGLSITGADDSDGSITPSKPDARSGATASCRGEALRHRQIRSFSPSRPLPLSRIETLSLCYPSSCDLGGVGRHPGGGGEASSRRCVRPHRRAQRYAGTASGEVRVTKAFCAVYRLRLRERRAMCG